MFFLGMLAVNVNAAQTDVTALCAKYEAEILRLVEGGQISQAIVRSAEYEQGLRGFCAVANITQGKFASADLRLDFNIPFAKEWKPASPKSIPNLEAVRAAGMEIMTMLDGPNEPEHLMLAMIDMKSFMRRASIKEAFTGVMVMDPIIMFGPDALKLMGPNDAENEDNRKMLSSMGRGSLLNLGKKIEGERFSKFHGRLAYEGSVDANNADLRMKCIVVRSSRAVYMIMLAGTAEILPEYEKMIDANLQIQDAGAGTSTKPEAANPLGR
jgi:hypothetical protein